MKLGRLLRMFGLRSGRPAPASPPAMPLAPEWDRYQRRSSRRYARRTALLVDAGREPIRCRIADISAHGMRLLLPDGVCDLPANFSLVVVESGILYRVRQVWRRKSELGVEFQASDALINDRTEELYFDLMRRVPSLSAWEVS